MKKLILLVMLLLVSIALTKTNEYPFIELEVDGQTGLWFDNDTADKIGYELKDRKLLLKEVEIYKGVATNATNYIAGSKKNEKEYKVKRIKVGAASGGASFLIGLILGILLVLL